MPKVIRREISAEAVEYLRELRRSIIYKSEGKKLKSKKGRAKNGSGPKRDPGVFLDKDKEKLKAAGAWESFGEKAKNCLKVGDRYIVRYRGVECEDPLSARSMIFMRIVYNRLGQPLFLFRCSAGYLESFTLQQLRDCTLRGGMGQCELW